VLELNSLNLADYLFSSDKISVPSPAIESLSGGVSALVFKISTPDKSFILKQACKQLRVKDLWLSDPARIEREFLFLSAFKSLAPNGSLAEALWHDNKNHVLAMSLAPAPAMPWKSELLGMTADPVRAQQAAEILFAIHNQGTGLKKNFPGLLDKTIFQQLRIEPFYERLALQFPEYATRINCLRKSLLEKDGTICHGDFSPKNLLLHPKGMTLVDHETAHFGDSTMDLGLFIAHLVLKCLYAKSSRSSYAELIRSFLKEYQSNAGKCDLEAQQSALGHLGVVLLTRVSGTSRVDYLDEPQKQEARTLAQSLLKGEINSWERFPPYSW
jgi:5-methylthioribose kinase